MVIQNCTLRLAPGPSRMNAAPDVVQFAADLGGDGAEAALQQALKHRDAKLLERWVEASAGRHPGGDLR